MSVQTLLLLAAAVLFLLSALGVTSRINLMAAGLLCWVLSQIING